MTDPRPAVARPRVLVVSRDDPDRSVLLEAVRAAGHRVSAVDRVTSGLAALSENPPGVLVVDLALGSDAMRLVRAAAHQPRPVPVVALADRRRPEASAEALRLAAIDIVARPVVGTAVQAALAGATEYRDALAQPAEPEPALPADGSLLLSLGLQKVLASVHHLARSRCHVLVVGEPGTGKEILARAIHALGGDPPAAFAAIDASYLAQEGGSTGGVERFEHQIRALMKAAVCEPGTRHPEPAPSTRHPAPEPGTQHPAPGTRHPAPGTLFLKSVDDLPLPVQGTLERLLLDGDASRPADARNPRVIASAGPSIDAALERRQFRRGLYECLGAVRLDLPPLRQRPQDIPLLAALFLKEACARHGAQPKTLAPPVRALLGAMPWRGNATELRRLVEQLALVVPHRVVQLDDLLAHVTLEGVGTRGRLQGTLREARERFERDYITSVLHYHRGRMGEAAKELGIERTNLYRKIRQLRIRL